MLYSCGGASFELYSTSHPYVWTCPLSNSSSSNFVFILGDDNLITTFSTFTDSGERIYTCSSWLAKLLEDFSFLCFRDRSLTRSLSTSSFAISDYSSHCYFVTYSDTDCGEIFLRSSPFPDFPPVTHRSKDD